MEPNYEEIKELWLKELDFMIGVRRVLFKLRTAPESKLSEDEKSLLMIFLFMVGVRMGATKESSVAHEDSSPETGWVDVLVVRMQGDSGSGQSVKQYLGRQLLEDWTGHGPDDPVYKTLIHAGVILGGVDRDGHVCGVDYESVDAMIETALKRLFGLKE